MKNLIVILSLLSMSSVSFASRITGDSYEKGLARIKQEKLDQAIVCVQDHSECSSSIDEQIRSADLVIRAARETLLSDDASSEDKDTAQELLLKATTLKGLIAIGNIK